LLEEVISSSGEPFRADETHERAIYETLDIMVQKIDNNTGEFCG
jgi:hypothetical protein